MLLLFWRTRVCTARPTLRHRSRLLSSAAPTRSSSSPSSPFSSPSSSAPSSYKPPRPRRYRDLSKPVHVWTVHIPQRSDTGSSGSDEAIWQAVLRAAPWLRDGDELKRRAASGGIRDEASGHSLTWADLQRPAQDGPRAVLVDNSRLQDNVIVTSTDPSSIDLDIIYEDEAIVCVNKPPGLPVQPQGADQLHNVLAALHHRYRQNDGALDVVPRLVHRLDVNTSGVLVVALDRKIAGRMGALLQSRQVIKQYSALVHGELRGQGVITAPIARAPKDPEGSRIQKFTVSPHGKPSETEYEGVHASAHWNASLVTFRPRTGRTHQIRVHSHHLGHPLLFDDRYHLHDHQQQAQQQQHEQQQQQSACSQLDNEFASHVRMRRCALHCDSMTFTHPATAETVTVRADWPRDFAHAVGVLKSQC
ncbi:hypothetical protein PTSG_07411 [Salpingoeca rosetta]|uniref:Pseudouridine synthase n=1 Tax=Salpingoeca rosetta (strain ATCC 50818 / BSB-021) TaxID=946362 RepID=F2UIM2_SALR5|nr:uncharacterized protein PTSG_07411 [Salpingoeca rosetta]EGD77071.1 hypothetical protein PTSG_07411 [Salpingoeca rosetta]|eukprot:XP_004990911.1 hypothetical protein PTSG_07411 [Salpingoeca rosetta]